MPEDTKPTAFPDTRWSLVLRAAQGDAPVMKAALADLYQTYWYPLYAFARREGRQAVDAEDLVQDFFVELNGKNLWADADPLRGRLRTFLLVCFRRWMARASRKERAQRRGGGAVHLPINTTGAEERYRSEPADARTPEALYAQRWAWELMEQVMRRLRAERETAGRAFEFDVLSQFLSLHLPTTDSYLDAARRLGVSENVVAVTVFRLRRRYREVARKVIADTLANPTEEELEDEWQELLRLLAARSGDWPAGE